LADRLSSHSSRIPDPHTQKEKLRSHLCHRPAAPAAMALPVGIATGAARRL
jgi:hypothetical protein